MYHHNVLRYVRSVLALQTRAPLTHALTYTCIIYLSIKMTMQRAQPSTHNPWLLHLKPDWSTSTTRVSRLAAALFKSALTAREGAAHDRVSLDGQVG